MDVAAPRQHLGCGRFALVVRVVLRHGPLRAPICLLVDLSHTSITTVGR